MTTNAARVEQIEDQLPIPDDGVTRVLGFVPVTDPKTCAIFVTFLVRSAANTGLTSRIRASIQGDPVAPVVLAITPEFEDSNIAGVPPVLSLALDNSGLNLEARINNPIAATGPVDASAQFDVRINP